MASQRMKNRVYWAHVKAQTYHAGTELAYRLKNAYVHAFRINSSDRKILDAYEGELLRIESEHGRAGLRNVHNRDLWEVRERLAMSNEGRG